MRVERTIVDEWLDPSYRGKRAREHRLPEELRQVEDDHGREQEVPREEPEEVTWEVPELRESASGFSKKVKSFECCV